MIGHGFESRLTKYTPKNVDGRTIMLFTLVYESTDKPIQNFLEALDEETDTNTMQSFRGEYEWNKIEFNTIHVSNLKIEFDGIKDIVADLKNIKVTFKETDDKINYKYELTFHKSLNADVDMIMNECYYMHKELNEEDKLKFINYNTKIERV